MGGEFSATTIPEFTAVTSSIQAFTNTFSLTDTTIFSTIAVNRISLAVTIENGESYIAANTFVQGELIQLHYYIVDNGPNIPDVHVLFTVYSPSLTPAFTGFSTVPLSSGGNEFFQVFSLSQNADIGAYQIEVVVLTDSLANAGKIVSGGTALANFQVVSQ